MTATVIPFPSIRRHNMARRCASAYADFRDPEKSIRATLGEMRKAMTRKGIEPSLIDADLAAFESLLRGFLAAYRAAEGLR